ncbi:hypothetical protein TcasGA2_TC001266 [Tribolium castaneum]|uniref:Uncharacterized protein n=1 Tax=Tribolium castaneum TaxID=7070 RepID=D6WBD0_TRICA|nr:PREDICTED: uncharacterized protein LOC103312160 [Tribolium castaneum]EEZ98720.2 hypothetical protein TcasGA2_TC001266 [Tribolium castaneum]|eukprot:XP_008190291.1 PREDICTED: uncharacterized protein LOC103312160 [Tribolium castaneum]
MKYHVVTILIFVISDGRGYPQGEAQISDVSVQNPSWHQAEDDSDMYLEPQESRVEDTGEREASQQTFYPSFSPFQNPPLGHSRPFFFQQEGAYSQRPHAGFQHQQLSYDSPRFSGYKDTGYRTAANAEARGLLGSGNFGVIRGGTFYDKDSDSGHYERDYSPFFKNGHGRPSYHGAPNPRPQQHQQFENFRDFADINTPNSAYSQYVVVYVNKNATKHHKDVTKPKNIIESLALLDSEVTTTEIPMKKLSKSKAKLAKLLPEKKHKLKKSPKESKASRELHEPLLALS